MLVFEIDDDAGGAVVERLHHFTFIQWHPFARWAGKAVAAGGIRAFTLLKLCARAEQVGVVGHVETSVVYFTGHAFTSSPDERSTSTGRRP